MNTESVRDMLVALIDAELDRLDSAPDALDASIVVGDDSFPNACSEGCQGVTPIRDAPGFVIGMKSGRRFHVTVRELQA